MKINILNLNGEKTKDIALSEEIFDITPNEKVLKDAIIVARASLRQGTAKTKNRAEVSGGGKKPWKQKGTGHARQGSIRAVQWVGGGVAFGPVPRDYSVKQNKKERRLALKSAWVNRAKDLLVVESINFDTPKTKEMVTVLKNFKLEDVKTLIVVNEYSENVLLASRNIGNIIVTKYDEVGVLDLISAEKILIEEEALKSVEEALK